MAGQQHDISHAKRAAFQVLAGGSAGFLEVCIMQPLDVVKTRIQIQATPAPNAAALGEVSVRRGNVVSQIVANAIKL